MSEPITQNVIPDNLISSFSYADDIFKNYKSTDAEILQAATTLIQQEITTTKAYHHPLIARLLEDSHQIYFLETNDIQPIEHLLTSFDVDLLLEPNSSNLFQTIIIIYFKQHQQSQIYSDIITQIFNNFSQVMESPYASKFLRALYSCELGISPEQHHKRKHFLPKTQKYLQFDSLGLLALNFTKKLLKFCTEIGFDKAVQVQETSQILQLYINNYKKIKPLHENLISPVEILVKALNFTRKTTEKVTENYFKRNYDKELIIDLILQFQTAKTITKEMSFFLEVSLAAPMNCYFAGSYLLSLEKIVNSGVENQFVIESCLENCYQFPFFVPILKKISDEIEDIFEMETGQKIVKNVLKSVARAVKVYKDECIEFLKLIMLIVGSNKFFVNRILHPGKDQNVVNIANTFKNNQKFDYSVLKKQAVGDAEIQEVKGQKRDTWKKIEQNLKQERFGMTFAQTLQKEVNGFWQIGSSILIQWLSINDFDAIELIQESLRQYFSQPKNTLMDIINHPTGLDVIIAVFQNNFVDFKLKIQILNELRGEFRELCFSKLGLLFLKSAIVMLKTSYSSENPIEINVETLRIIATELTPRPVVYKLRQRSEGEDVLNEIVLEGFMRDMETWKKAMFKGLKWYEKSYKNSIKRDKKKQEKDGEQKDTTEKPEEAKVDEK